MEIFELIRSQVKEGDHLCSIYTNLEEQFSIIAPFMKHGLEKGEKCIYIVDEQTAESATKLFLDYVVNLKYYIKLGAFTFLTKEETYLKDGYFDPTLKIDLLSTHQEKALQEGYSGLRVTGENTWILSSLSGTDRFMEYEAKLNKFLPGSKITAICQFNENKFQPEILLDVLRTHPEVILYGEYYKNSYYEDPEIFLARLDGKVTHDMYQKAVNIIKHNKKMEKSIREKEKQYRNLISSLSEGVILEKYTGEIVTFNESAENILGLKAEEVTGHSSTDLEMIKEDGSKFLKEDYPSKYTLATGESCRDVVMGFYSNDGKVTWINVNTNPIYKENNNKPEEVVISFTDITSFKEAQDKIRYLSFHDSFTGLYNRAYIEEEMKRLDTNRQLPFSIIIADANGLKLVNDTYGHEIGDEMLKKASEVLKLSTRKEDIVGRWGGDEFIILLPKTLKEEAEKVCKRINENCKNIYIQDIPISVALGASTKDHVDEELKEVVKEAEDKMYNAKLAESKSTKSSVVNTLLEAMEAKSFETRQHIQIMQELALKIGEKLNLTEPELKRLKLLIALHDIGKINIPEKILTKAGPLTLKEWENIKKHPELGYRIARSSEEFAHVAEEIWAHHERWDGKGYPRGLQGEEIPLLARITVIADAYEVMSSGRPYKKAVSRDEIIKEFRRCAGTQFDPDLVEVFIKQIENHNIMSS